MLVKEWMSTPLITARPETTLLEAARRMRQHRIRRLPVVDPAGHLVGIISDRDIKEASPSKATTLDVHEHHYLFAELTVGDYMTRQVITVSPQDSVERAAAIMVRHKVTGLPVVEGGRAVGMISQDDVSRVLTEATGVTQGGPQFALLLDDQPETVDRALELIRRHGGRLISLLSLSERVPRGKRKVFIRIDRLAASAQEALTRELAAAFQLLYVESSTPPQDRLPHSG
jgi:acetoin utilization protein AcuB